MSDPLGITASVIAVLQLAVTATQYLKDVKHGSADRLRLRDELRSTVCLVEMLKDRVEDIDDDSETEEILKPASMKALVESDGPLSLFERVLQDIVTKLEPQAGLRRLAQPLTWPFDKKDIAEMLASLERLKSHFNLIMQNDLHELAKLSHLKLDDLKDKADGFEDRARNEETLKIVSWISPLSFRTWLLEHGTFQSWTRGDIDKLWCPGIPGAGKTSLVSLIIKRAEQTSSALISSLLQQVLQHFTGQPLPAEVSLLYSQHQRYGTRPTQAQATELLRTLAAKLDRVSILIDALDELGESEEDALQFMETISSLGPHVKILCTSRFSTTLEEYFSEATKLQISAQNEDIAKFLEAQISQKYRLSRHVRADPKLKDEITETIIKESQGMFLLPKLHLESISHKINRKEVRLSLKTLPVSLNATYSDALDRIYRQASEAVDLAEAVLFWILCAKRPLTILELQQIYATQDLSDDTGLEDDDLPDADILTSVCGGLIMIDSDSQTVRLIHYTAQQYFEQSQCEKLMQARASITNISLKYLTLPNFSSGICTTDRDMAQRLDEYPFLDYAAKYWGADINLINGEESEDFFPALDNLVSSATALGATSQAFALRSDRHSNWSQEFPKNIPALVLAASFNLPRVLKRMVENGHALEGKGTDEETALIRAASFGHQDNVRTLLELGADKDARDHMNETALQRAAGNGDAGVVEVLLSKDANVNVHTSSDWTALMSAISSGNIQVVRMLVDTGADLIAETVWGDSALSIATRNCQEAISTLLADRGAVLPRGPAGRRASTVASRRGFTQLVRRLTADYEAVARQPLQRQGSRIMGGMPQIQEAAELEQEKTAAEQVDTEESDFSSVTEGLDYSIGFSRRYELTEKLGKGHFAEVFACTNRVTGMVYATKVFKIEGWKGDVTKVRGIRAEFQAIPRAGSVSHDNIIRLFDIFAEYTECKIYIVLELAPGGELFNYIVMKQRLTEDETRKIFLQIFSALEYLHDLGWVHRDIKPENILLSDTENLHIKLGDLGLAKKVGSEPDETELATTLCGTPSYVAPEILVELAQRKYGLGVDVWSAGVVLYICLCGFPPFSDELYSTEYPYTLLQQITSGMFDYPSPYWDDVGDPALDLVDSMLIVDPAKRFDVKRCMSHPWTALNSGTLVLQDTVRSASPEAI
ncbi:serine/threonine-protein kinase chk2 (cds1) [Fusarium flagelliforme]|uniref:Serine/threonine-protein kinase chk2 (Cds1) n=1 Tax=Fusarium flagelliforme TaxID=2675880 RepID=A0A395M8E3_9HYPO|nr:serine/threonine-protein kinase chk2 (cds1) [Fusarium flagelliforme]